MNLNLLMLLPLLAAFFITVAKEDIAKKIALGASALQLFLLALLTFQFMQVQPGPGAYAFEYRYDWFKSLGISYHLGIDGISVSMLWLTAIVVFAGVLVSWKVEKMKKEFFLLLMVLSAGAYGFFISLDLFTMFFFLEVAVIPKYLLIGIWGSGDKERSARKLALMLMGASALIFIGLVCLYYMNHEGFDLVRLSGKSIPTSIQMYIFPFLFFGFGIFTAIFPFHTWVPDGHSSAPTAASMFLAGISMKLGGYGCLRVAIYLLPEAAKEYSFLIVLLAVIAIVYGAFATMMQKDLKYMNAYSSISHCGFVILGIGMLTPASINGAILQMISHGLMTALFFAAIGMIYERTHTREIARLGGLLKVMPFISTVFILAGLCSLGLPGLSGFVSEMTVFTGSWQREGMFYRTATILSCMSIVVTAVYILRASGFSLMGPLKFKEYESLTDAGWNERLAAVVLIVSILVIGLLPFTVNDLIHEGTESIVNRLISIR